MTNFPSTAVRERTPHRIRLAQVICLVLVASALTTQAGGEATGGTVIVSRTKTSTTYRNADGTYTARMYTVPVNYERADGDWAAVDPTIVADSGGGYRNRAGHVTVRFAASTDAAEPVELEGDDWALRLGMEGAARSRAGQASGRRVTYRTIAPDTDLEYTVGLSAVKENIILKRPPRGDGPVRFRSLMTLDGLDAEQHDDGVVAFTDDKGKVQVRIPQAVMSDSSAGPGEPAEQPLDVSLVERENKPIVEVTADRDWLADPARVYPVYIDPTWWFISTADTYVRSATPTTTYAGEQKAKMGYYDASTGTNRTYMRFDGLSAIDGRTILSAVWNGYFTYSASTSNTSYWVRPVNGAWVSTDTYWNKQPPLRSEVLTGTGRQGQWSQFTMTSWVQNWVNGTWTNYGLEFDENGNGASFYKWVASANDVSTPSLIPYLTVTWEPLEPTFTATDPESPADDGTPRIKGDAENNQTIKLYKTNDCSGSPIVTGPIATFRSPGLSVTVPQDSRTIFRATATDSAGHVSPCSESSILYDEATAVGSDPEFNDDSGPRAGVLQWAPTSRPGEGRLLDLCDDTDAADAGLDRGELTEERERLGVSCNGEAGDWVRYAVLHAAGAVRLYTQEDVDAAGTTALLSRGAEPPLIELGSFSLGYDAPQPWPVGLSVLSDSLTLTDGVARGLIFNGSGQFAGEVTVTIATSSGIVGAQTLPMTVQSGEAVPFEIPITGNPALEDLQPTATGTLNLTPDLDRSVLISDQPGGWVGPPSAFLGIDSLAEDIPAGDDPIFYYETGLEPAFPYAPLASSIHIEDLRVTVGLLSDGRVMDVIEPEVYETSSGSDPAGALDAGNHALLGFFLPDNADAFILHAWDGQ